MPNGVHCPDTSDLAALPAFAVAIQDQGHPHVGVLYRREGKVELLHLMGHDKLAVDDALAVVPLNWCWVIPQMHEMELRQLAGFARVQASRRRTVAFSFRYNPDEFKYVRGGDVVFTGLNGFTCATYVLSIIDYLKRPFLDYATWLPRQGDDQKQERMFAYLAPRAPREHVAKAWLELYCLRFRPEDVAGACLATDRPVPMPIAESLGSVVMREVFDYYTRA
jgi:hypothetical protein